MPDFKEIEARFREKYRFPDDETTNDSPMETILIGGLKRAVEQANLNQTSIIIEYNIGRNRRLRNLVAMLWKALQQEGFGVGLLASAIFNNRHVTDVEKKVNKIIADVIQVLPQVNDAELMALRARNKRLGLDAESMLARNTEIMDSVLPTLRDTQILDMSRKCKAKQVFFTDRASIGVLDQKLKDQMAERNLTLEEEPLPPLVARKSRKRQRHKA